MKNIKEARTKAGLSQTELGLKLGVSQGAVYSWEKKGRVPEKYEGKLVQVLSSEVSVAGRSGQSSLAGRPSARKHVKEARAEAGLSQAKLGQKLGVSQGAVYSWEKKGRVPEKYRAGLLEILGVGSLGASDQGESDLINVRETSLQLENDLESFLCDDLAQVEHGLRLCENGRQFVTAVGRVDVLATDRNGALLVIELKAGKATDGALGQLLGYMACVSDDVAKGKSVRGCIIASEFDDRLKRAVRHLPLVTLKAYRVNFSFEDVK
jgi:DNA-binding transcriptional regulator YiaG